MTAIPHYDIEISTTPYIGYAQAFNKIPFITRIVLSSKNNVYLRDVQIELRVRVASGDLSTPVLVTLDQLGAHHTYEEDAFDGSGALRPIFEGTGLNTLLAVDTIQSGTVEVTLIHADVMIGNAAATIMVVPARVWAWENPKNHTAVNLAAYVLHYHPVIEEVIDRARKILRQQGKSDSFEGYQGSPEEVNRQAKAIYEALLQYQITYINPPTSWEAQAMLGNKSTGVQPIRTPELVLERKLGTCIDTAILFAAVFEHVGIRPILFIIPEHAFVGYWRVEQRFDRPLVPLSEALNDIDEQRIGLIETTTITRNESFEASLVEARSSLNRPKNHVTQNDAVCIDIHVARIKSGVLPIPSRMQQENGEIVIIQPPKVVYRTTFVEGKSHQPTFLDTEKDVPRRVVQWKNQLLDLSLRNRLINFKIDRPGYVQIPVEATTLGVFEDHLNVRPLVLGCYPSDEVYEILQVALINRSEVKETLGSGYDLNAIRSNGTVFAHLRPDRYLSVIRKIVRTAKNIIDETGVNQLYLALGSLVWSTEGIAKAVKVAGRKKNDAEPDTAAEAKEPPKLSDLTLQPGEIRSPLLLIPITIKSVKRGNTYEISLDDSSPVMPNFSLLEKLNRELKFDLPKLRNPDQDAHGIDINGVFKHIRERIAEEGMAFRVDETCVIGFFDFGNYRLWRDLGDNWQKYVETPLIHHMVYQQNKAFTSPPATDIARIDLDDLASELPIPADSSQIKAIRLALAKQTFVLQGPPGTGKSQTIANLIFAAMRRNMSVLFVTEKSTAAEVVYERLSSIKGDSGEGIETMVLDIHDQDSKPDAVKMQLTRALDANIEGDKTGYAAHHREYDQYIHTLKAYPERLNRVGSFGYSLITARDELLTLKPSKTIALPMKFFIEAKKRDVDAIVESLKHVRDSATNVGNAARNPWTFIGNSMSVTSLTQPFFDELKTVIEQLYTAKSTFARTPAIADVLETIGSRNDLAQLHVVTESDGIDHVAAKEHALPANVEARARIRASIKSLKAQSMGKVSISDSAIDIAFDNLFGVLESAKNSFIFGRAGRIDAAQNAILGFLIRGSFLNYSTPADFLADIATYQRTAQELRNDVRGYEVLAVDRDWNPLESTHITKVEAELDAYDALAAHAKKASTTIPTMTQVALRECSDQQKLQLSTFATTIDRFLSLVALGTQATDQWRGRLPIAQKIFAAIDDLYVDAVQNGFLLMSRWVKFGDSVGVLSKYEMDDFSREILAGTYNSDDLTTIFLRSFLTKHIERLLLEANLDQFDGREHDLHVSRFREASKMLRSFVSGMALEEMLEYRRDYMRANIGDVTELRRELQKTKRQLKVRQLLSVHSQVIRMLMPCTIASPNSIAMLLDVTATPYDLVIFDEASQIRVTSAICGLGRANSAIIVGDSKQMPPTSIAEKTLFDESDELDEASPIDEESILSECVLAQIPSETLTWHYRSENELLIAFSNQAYYDGRLSAFPSPKRKTNASPSVKFVRINGQFIRTTTDHEAFVPLLPPVALPDGVKAKAKKQSGNAKGDLLNTNPVEARAVYEYIVELMNNPETSMYSVGIVTFNVAQAGLIMDRFILAPNGDPMVKTRFAEDYKDTRTHGFVKSLETIQGDEADIILFSVAFSKNEQNKLPLNFGPLTRSGGERRLNVAVTRARKQVVVFCSFDPSELRADETTSRGIRDLRDYLVLAKDGPEASSKTNTRSHTSNRYRDEIAEAFRQAGMDVRTDVGLTEFKIDMVIADRGEPSRSMAILLDGSRWYERATVSDRDVFPVDMLTKRMGWMAVERIWTPMWMRNPAAEVRRILEKFAGLPLVLEESVPVPIRIELVQPTEESDAEHAPTKTSEPSQTSALTDAIVVSEETEKPDDSTSSDTLRTDATERVTGADTGTSETASADEHTPSATNQSEPRKPDAQSPSVTPPSSPAPETTISPIPSASSVIRHRVEVLLWEPWVPQVMGDKSVLDNPTTSMNKRIIHDVMREILLCEAPVESKRFARLVGTAFGFGKMSEARMSVLLEMLPRKFAQDKEDFLYPEGIEPKVYTGTRSSPQTERHIDDICLPEVGNAMLYILGQHGDMPKDEAFAETMRWFGGARMSTTMWYRIHTAVEAYRKLKRLKEHDGMLKCFDK